MVYRKEIRITKKLADEINHLLTVVDKNFGDDSTISVTAIFDNGSEMDIKCCGSNEEPAWTEAVLFHNGSEVCCSDPSDEFVGEWELRNDEDIYIVNVTVENS